jgi:hypothetical protein
MKIMTKNIFNVCERNYSKISKIMTFEQFSVYMKYLKKRGGGGADQLLDMLLFVIFTRNFAIYANTINLAIFTSRLRSYRSCIKLTRSVNSQQLF